MIPLDETRNVLVIDDLRSFKGKVHSDDTKVTYARNLDEMISLLPPYDDTEWVEIWLDFDMGERETVYDVLKRWIWEVDLVTLKYYFNPTFYVHSSNPVGAQMLIDFLNDNRFYNVRVAASDYMEVVEDA